MGAYPGEPGVVQVSAAVKLRLSSAFFFDAQPRLQQIWLCVFLKKYLPQIAQRARLASSLAAFNACQRSASLWLLRARLHSSLHVFELEHLYTHEYQKDLEQADVIVATPSCALSLSESDWAKENIDLVEVDEAHHTPAKTWQQILVNLSVATHVLFTATPFRLD